MRYPFVLVFVVAAIARDLSGMRMALPKYNHECPRAPKSSQRKERKNRRRRFPHGH